MVCELVSSKKDCYAHGGWIAVAETAQETQNTDAVDYCEKMGSHQEISRCQGNGGYMVQADSHPKVRVTLCELLSNKEEMERCYARVYGFLPPTIGISLGPALRERVTTARPSRPRLNKFERAIGPLQYSFNTKLKFRNNFLVLDLHCL